MKKLTIVLLLTLTMIGTSLTMAFAGGYDPCRSLAFQFCAEKLKVKATNTGPNGEAYCTVNPTTAEFKKCEADARVVCKANGQLDLTQKPCV